jgi:hypothetical protein
MKSRQYKAFSSWLLAESRPSLFLPPQAARLAENPAGIAHLDRAFLVSYDKDEPVTDPSFMSLT